jgi:hypothetical protein
VTDLSVIDNDVRQHIYRAFLATGAPPRPATTAQALSMTDTDAAAAYDRLAAGRVIVLEPGTHDILMAAPLSAVPTRYHVTLRDGRTYYANCVWDAMGVFAMLASDGEVETSCPDCGASLELGMRAGALVAGESIVHFAVPAADWWKDIAFT